MALRWSYRWELHHLLELSGLLSRKRSTVTTARRRPKQRSDYGRAAIVILSVCNWHEAGGAAATNASPFSRDPISSLSTMPFVTLIRRRWRDPPVQRHAALSAYVGHRDLLVVPPGFALISAAL